MDAHLQGGSCFLRLGLHCGIVRLKAYETRKAREGKVERTLGMPNAQNFEEECVVAMQNQPLLQLSRVGMWCPLMTAQSKSLECLSIS